MAEKIQGIVLKSNDRKEKDVNILLFSLEKGKIWATLRGVKSPKDENCAKYVFIWEFYY